MVILKLDAEEILIVEEIEVNEPSDVVHIEDSLIIPLVYDNVGILDSLEGAELKRKFVDILLPSILIAKYRIDKQREKLSRLDKKIRWHKRDSLLFKNLSKEYKADTINELLDKLTTHPNSIVLAQAAIESGWGRSRFCKEANNLFGIWSFNKSEPRIKASNSRGNKDIYLRKYESLSHSIEDYFKILARSHTYKKFRDQRLNNNNPFELVEYLSHYSEKRGEYVRLLKEIIKQNELTQYDNYKIDPEYIVVERKLR